MADQFLNKDGVKTLWAKIKSLVSGKLDKSGGTMGGNLILKNGAYANGSRQANSNTIPELIDELRKGTGVNGSVEITTAYSFGGKTLPTGWYNFQWIPHRFGEKQNDNSDYGHLIMFPMTFDGEYFYIIRYNVKIDSLHKLNTDYTFEWVDGGRQPSWVLGGELYNDIKCYNPNLFQVDKATNALQLVQSSNVNNYYTYESLNSALNGKANASDLNNYLKLSGGTMTGDLIISNGSKLRFAEPNYGLSGIYTSEITVTMSSTSGGGQCNTTATAPSNSGGGKWYVICLPTGPYSEWYTVACNGQGLDNNGKANIYCMRIKTGPVFTCTIRLIWVKIW